MITKHKTEDICIFTDIETNTDIVNKNTDIVNKNTDIVNKCIKCNKVLSSKQYLKNIY